MGGAVRQVPQRFPQQRRGFIVGAKFNGRTGS